jgi:hypothetical protein
MLTRSNLLVPVLVLAALAASCGVGSDDPSPSAVPGEVALDVLIDDDAGISIQAVYPLEEWRPLAAVGSAQLGYQLRQGEETVVAGQIPDPRFMNSETGGEIRLSFGTASLRLPAEAGELVFLEGTSEIGRVAFDPSAVRPQLEDEQEEEEAEGGGIGMARSPLLRDGDVRGRADRIFGDLPRRSGVDLLFLAEGYTANQLGRFRRDARAIARSFRSIMDRQRRYGGRFNIWVQNVRSRSSGIDDPRADRRADTAFDITFGTGERRRCTWFNTAGGESAARELGRRRGADVVVILANAREYGGCANNGLFVVTRHSDAPWVVAHELGHALLGLADEYEAGECRHDAAPNVAFSTRRARIPWGGQIGIATPIPTPENAINRATLGAFEGASYCEEGAFRPQLNCLMRELRRGFCRVCLGRLDRFLATLRRNGQGGGTPCTEEMRGDGVCDTCLEDDPDCDGGGGGGGSGACGDGTCAQDETDESCAADCGCAASSCAISPFGCFCDPECTTTGDCCADACEACGSC